MKINKTKSILTALCVLLISQPKAATFCATNSFELQGFLSMAENNGESDLIKIANGAYIAPFDIDGFDYSNVPTENYDLEISGGWSSFFGNPCGEQLSTSSPVDTVLNGNSDRKILTIRTYNNVNITISNLLFANGFSTGTSAALEIIAGTQNNILIESNIFIGNSADSGSAIHISNRTKTIVRNNLIINNHNNEDSAVMLDIANPDQFTKGFYFTNNTVISNTSFNISPSACAGARINVHGIGQAFVANNILWDNDINDLNLPSNGYNYIKNNNIGSKIGFSWEESGNIYESPQIEPGTNSFMLAANSPLINSGLKPPNVINIPPNFDQTWSLGGLDVLRDQRVQQGKIDIGAHESDYRPDPLFNNSFED